MDKIHRHYFSVLLAMLSMLSMLFLGACGQSSQSVEERAAEPTFQPDAIVNLYLSYKIISMDPVLAGGDSYSNRIASYVLESMFGYDYFGKGYQLVPLLAEEMPEVSADGLTYTFGIKKGIYYYDPRHEVFEDRQRDVQAKDVVFSILRLADIAEKGKGFWLIDGFIQGLNEWREGSDSGGDYQNLPTGLKVLGDYSFQVTLTKPYPQFLYFLSMNYSAPLPKEVYDFYGRDNLTTRMIGTGPYFLDPEQTIDDNRYIYRVNPTFRTVLIDSPTAPAELKGQSLPLNGGIDIKIIGESVPAWLSFQQGDIDIYSPGKDQFEQAIVGGEPTPALRERGVKLYINPGTNVTYGFINMEHPDWKDIVQDPHKGPKLRRAMRMAIDQETIVELQYNNRAVPAQSPVPPVFEGFQDYKNPNAKYDPEAAKALLAEAGFAGGEGLPVLVYEAASSKKASRDLYELVSRYYGEIGIQTEYVVNDWPTFAGKLDSGDFAYARLGWGADYPDPQNFLQLLYGGSAVDGGVNYAHYRNAEYDILYDKAAVMQPSAERTALYLQMVKVLEQDMPWVLGINSLSYAMKHERIRNYRFRNFGRASAQYYQIVE